MRNSRRPDHTSVRPCESARSVEPRHLAHPLCLVHPLLSGRRAALVSVTPVDHCRPRSPCGLKSPTLSCLMRVSLGQATCRICMMTTAPKSMRELIYVCRRIVFRAMSNENLLECRLEAVNKVRRVSADRSLFLRADCTRCKLVSLLTVS